MTMMTRKRAAANSSEKKKLKMTQPSEVLENIIREYAGKKIESVSKGVKKVLELKEVEIKRLRENLDLKEVEVQMLRENLKSLELAMEETNKENQKLKQQVSLAKSCNGCKKHTAQIKTHEQDLLNFKLKSETEDNRLRQHLFNKKEKIKNLISILKERDEKIEEMESQREEELQKGKDRKDEDQEGVGELEENVQEEEDQEKEEDQEHTEKYQEEELEGTDVTENGAESKDVVPSSKSEDIFNQIDEALKTYSTSNSDKTPFTSSEVENVKSSENSGSRGSTLTTYEKKSKLRNRS